MQYLGMSQTTTQNYKKKCSRCQREILMTNATASGKWKAMDADGTTFHICSSGNEQNGNTKDDQQQRQQQQPQQQPHHEEIKRPAAFTATMTVPPLKSAPAQAQASAATTTTTAAAQAFPYDLKIEFTEKGLTMISAHTCSTDIIKVSEECVRLLTETIADLKIQGISNEAVERLIKGADALE